MARRRAAQSDAQRSAPSCAGCAYRLTTPQACSVASSHSGTTRHRASCASRRIRAASPATLTPTTRTGAQVVPVAERQRADLGVRRHAERQPAARPVQPHLTRLLPTSMTRSWLIARGNGVGGDGRCGRRRSGAPHRYLAGEEAGAAGPSASTSAPLASTPATLPVTTAPSGSSSRTSLPGRRGGAAIRRRRARSLRARTGRGPPPVRRGAAPAAVAVDRRRLLARDRGEVRHRRLDVLADLDRQPDVEAHADDRRRRPERVAVHLDQDAADLEMPVHEVVRPLQRDAGEPSASSARATATPTARLRPARKPAPCSNCQPSENVRLPPATAVQLRPRRPRPAVCHSAARTTPWMSRRWTRRKSSVEVESTWSTTSMASRGAASSPAGAFPVGPRRPWHRGNPGLPAAGSRSP